VPVGLTLQMLINFAAMNGISEDSQILAFDASVMLEIVEIKTATSPLGDKAVVLILN
jgi:hypothetical protein